MDKIWYRNPSKSKVIGRCGAEEKTRMTTQNRPKVEGNFYRRFYNYNGLNRCLLWAMAIEDLKIVHTVFLKQGHTCSDLVSFIDSLSMSVIIELTILVHTYSVTLKYQKFIIEKNISSKQNIG